MKIVHFNQITIERRAQISRIVEECRSQGVHLTFPYAEASSFYVLCDPEPVSVLALLLPNTEQGEDFAECSAFTRPVCRRRGYFSALLEEALKEAEDLDLCFFADPADEGARMALRAIDADFLDSEYRMDLSLDQCRSRDCGTRLACSVGEEPKSGGSSPEQELSFSFVQRLPEREHPQGMEAGCENGPLVGAAQISLYENSACLHGFEIVPCFRRMGFGREALSLLTARLKTLGVGSLFLHVSESNKNAVALYKEAGFRVSETLSCYLY